MRCPHCNTAINTEWEESNAYGKDLRQGVMATAVSYGECPECGSLIVKLVRGIALKMDYYYRIGEDEPQSEEVIYPILATRYVEPEVPEVYRTDFMEASGVLRISPKASAALSRRILQLVLREHMQIKAANLAQEIEEFVHKSGVPSHLADAVDAVRQIGNFAAHPLKNSNTGELVEVEPGEAEWLLDVLEAMFDFAFVQPERLKRRKERLNEKLQTMGKPEMKGRRPTQALKRTPNGAA